MDKNKTAHACGERIRRLIAARTMSMGVYRVTDDEADVIKTLRAVLRDVLSLDSDRVEAMTEATKLFGALPEMDSMAVATLLTELEDRLGIVIDDDDIEAETFESFGSLAAFLLRKALS